MSEGPVRIGSFLFYQILVFLIIFVWSVMGFEVAQFQLPTVYEHQLNWVVWATFTLVSIIPALTAVTWRMKTRVEFTEPDWDFREREVTFTEYEQMLKQYTSEYRNFLAVIDYWFLSMAIILSVLSIIMPILLLRTTIFWIAATPAIFGFFILMYGLVLSSFLFKFIPNEATPYFPIVSANVFHGPIRTMIAIPGISWAGVSLTLGESSGLYTIRNPSPVARIEGIESAARIQCVLDKSSSISKVISTLYLDDPDSPRVFDELSGEISARQITELVQRTLLSYQEAKGADEVLDEVLEEIAFYLRRVDEDD